MAWVVVCVVAVCVEAVWLLKNEALVEFVVPCKAPHHMDAAGAVRRLMQRQRKACRGCVGFVPPRLRERLSKASLSGTGFSREEASPNTVRFAV